MAFRWTPSRSARLASAVRSFNRALTMRARELVDAGLAHLVQFLPSRVTTTEIRDEVRDVNDFRRIVGYRNDRFRGRPSRLDRILKSVRPDALDFREKEPGAVTTVYADREAATDRRAIRAQRRRSVKDMGRPLYEGDEAVDMESMSAPELGATLSDTDMMPEDAGEPDDSCTDVDAATLERWRQEDARAKRSQVMPDAMYEVWMDVWTNALNHHQDMPGFRDVVDAMGWLVENRVDVLNKMFNSARDEMDPQYVTDSGGASNPYSNIPYETRHNRVVRYVTERARGAGWNG